MSYFILAILALILAVVLLTACFIVCMKYSLKDLLKSAEGVPTLLLSLLLIFASIFCFKVCKTEIESNAIDHYVVGDVEIIEIHDRDGEVIDWTYKITNADYD